MKIVLNKQYVYSVIVAYMLSFLAILNHGNEILNLIGLPTQLDTMLFYGLLVGFVVLGLVMTFKDGKNLKTDAFMIISFLFVAFLLTFLIYPKNTRYLFTSWSDYASNPMYILFLYSLPGLIFARQLEDYDCFKRVMKVFSYITVIMSVIVFFFAKGSAASQYMTFSYNMLTQLFFLLVYKPSKYKSLHYVVLSLGLFVFVFGGARGAMLSLLATSLVLYFVNYKPNTKNVTISILILLAGVIFAIFKEEILLFISNILESFSIDSRTLRYLAAGELLDDSTRTPLYETSLANIGVLGKGIMGDRIILNSYPHNILLELLVQYGWIVGTVLIFLIVGCISASLMRKEKPEFIFIIILLPCGFLKLMLTGSYLHQEPAFYILLGFCLNAVLRRNGYANIDDKHDIFGR